MEHYIRLPVKSRGTDFPVKNIKKTGMKEDAEKKRATSLARISRISVHMHLRKCKKARKRESDQRKRKRGEVVATYLSGLLLLL